MRICARIHRQAEALNLIKWKHREMFPNAEIIDSDSEEWASIQKANPRTGLEMIRARASAPQQASPDVVEGGDD